MHASSWTNSFIHTYTPSTTTTTTTNTTTQPATHSLTYSPLAVFGREEEEEDEEDGKEEEPTVDDPSQCIHDNQQNKETATPGSCKTKQGKTHREQTTSCLLTYK